MKRWLLAVALAVTGSIWLPWAFPRLHPSAALALQFDRAGYLAKARQTAARQGIDVSRWTGYVKAESQANNLMLRQHFPADPVARTFPPGDVLTNFLPGDEGAAVSLTLRPDARPLGWKLPTALSGPNSDPRAAADSALREIAGEDAAKYQLSTEAAAGSDPVRFIFQRTEPGPETPQVSIETEVSKGIVRRAKSTFTLPEEFKKRIDFFPSLRIFGGVTWFGLLVGAFAYTIRWEGGGNGARAMRDRSVIRLSAFGGFMVGITAALEWDDQMISVPSMPGLTLEIFGLVLGATIIGVLVYATSACTVLNARVHGPLVRGLRLAPTRALFSRNVGAELLGGLLMAPALVSIPLAVGAIMRVPLSRGFDDAILLNRAPVLDALSNALAQDTVAILAFAGVMIPSALRFWRFRWIRKVLIAAMALVTFIMLPGPLRESQPGILAGAILTGALMIWVYARFGILGTLAAYASSKVLTSAAVLLVQPAAGLHSSGIGILTTLFGFGVFALILTWKGPEVATALDGESGPVQRSRREELLAEFNVARSAQQQMLPSKFPALAGYTVAASCEPAREVGGDLYDFLRLGDGRWGIGVADVSGKGVPAALYMTLTKGLLWAAAQDSGNPYEILGSVNKHLRDAARKKVFVTMALGVLDPASKTLEYVRAGHNPVVWRRPGAGETRMLASSGVGLGIASPALFARTLATEIIDLAPGDALVFYSDGLTEAMNEVLEQFGDDRLKAAVERADGLNAAATIQSILGEVRRFLEGVHPQDDLTIAVLRVNSEASESRSNGG